MIIDRIIFCLNNNKTYTGFWNINSRIWCEKYNLKPTLFFVGDHKEFSDLNLSKDFGEVFFLPINKDLSNGSSRNWVVTWSLFYGATFFQNEICMLSGIDQIPLSNDILNLANSYDNKYLVSFSDAYNDREDLFPSSHHVGLGKDFKEIYEISNDWKEEVDKVYNTRGRYKTIEWDNWGLDEAYSSECINKKRISSDRIVLVKKFFSNWADKRIDFRKNGLNHDLNLLKSGHYSELHSPRPYENYQQEINKIIFNCHNIRI